MTLNHGVVVRVTRRSPKNIPFCLGTLIGSLPQKLVVPQIPKWSDYGRLEKGQLLTDPIRRV